MTDTKSELVKRLRKPAHPTPSYAKLFHEREEASAALSRYEAALREIIEADEARDAANVLYSSNMTSDRAHDEYVQADERFWAAIEAARAMTTTIRAALENKNG